MPHVRDRHQLPTGETEASVCERFLEIVNPAGLRPTIYASGKIVEAQRQQLRQLCRRFDFEIGRHTYYCYQPFLPYRLSHRLLGLANGPRFFQSFEIAKTLRALTAATDREIVTWRNRAFRQDRNTFGDSCSSGLYGDRRQYVGASNAGCELEP
jgi:hypothetical protein